MIRYDKILDNDFCDYVVDYVKSNCHQSKTKERFSWSMWNIWGESSLPNLESSFYDESFKEIVFDKLRKTFNIDDYDLLWLQMTEYKNYEALRNHLDSKLNKTMIVLLTDKFIGGDTLLDSVKVDFNKGDAILFDGYRVFHQVTPVHSGVRNALNIWLKPKTNKLI